MEMVAAASSVQLDQTMTAKQKLDRLLRALQDSSTKTGGHRKSAQEIFRLLCPNPDPAMSTARLDKVSEPSANAPVRTRV
jgi:hypothetical protein